MALDPEFRLAAAAGVGGGADGLIFKGKRVGDDLSRSISRSIFAVLSDKI